jgi:hypothetical protein
MLSMTSRNQGQINKTKVGDNKAALLQHLLDRPDDSEDAKLLPVLGTHAAADPYPAGRRVEKPEA